MSEASPVPVKTKLTPAQRWDLFLSRLSPESRAYASELAESARQPSPGLEASTGVRRASLRSSEEEAFDRLIAKLPPAVVENLVQAEATSTAGREVDVGAVETAEAVAGREAEVARAFAKDRYHLISFVDREFPTVTSRDTLDEALQLLDGLSEQDAFAVICYGQVFPITMFPALGVLIPPGDIVAHFDGRQTRRTPVEDGLVLAPHNYVGPAEFVDFLYPPTDVVDPAPGPSAASSDVAEVAADADADVDDADSGDSADT